MTKEFTQEEQRVINAGREFIESLNALSENQFLILTNEDVDDTWQLQFQCEERLVEAITWFQGDEHGTR
jgi:hypothetical protein